MTIPKKVAEYKTREYWDSRFQTESSYEWLCSFDDFAADICSFIEPDFAILVLGCGSSSLPYDLYQKGYHNVTSIDFSKVAIDNMKRRYAHISCLKWVVGDVRELSVIFQDDQFDVIVDKGTFEALISDEGDPWSPNDLTKKDVDLLLSGVQRILRPKGFYFHISFIQPFFRSKYLRKFEENENPYDLDLISVRTIPVGLGYYMYTMSKMVR
ncbi:hypothetical protein GpartN1_g1552.t1 [Galdieria partita]|uniref:Methyltransferase domain-containing protein n=1 Tax=Galdieria partita TaxID=83374 RepID=A0A9C7UNR3_9RHOD|nr:hypothetical protein GpartN1_g505.t1 [Galdieria partita]GJQ09761.1 hypothetical protein GpartN1_g1552.t1 [Galdieria partita]